MILTRGLSSSFSSSFVQVGGVLASILSVAKVCAEWHLYTGFNYHITDIISEDRQVPPEIIPTLKAVLFFFLPHVLFRTTSTAVVLAFFKIYSLVPILLFLLLSGGIHGFLFKRYKSDPASNLVNFLLTLTFNLTAACNAPFIKFNRRLLKATMLASTLTLLPCLLLILLLPHLLSPSTLLCTWGLDHINLPTNVIPSCSPCFNVTANTTGVPQMIRKGDIRIPLVHCHQDDDGDNDEVKLFSFLAVKIRSAS